MIIDEVEFPVEAGKVREFVIAVGLGDPPDRVPPTFVTVAGHWRDQAAMVEKLGLEITRVVVGGSEWEFLAPIRIGDRLRGTRMLVGSEERPTMRLLTLETRFARVEDGMAVVVQRDTVIEVTAS